MKPRYLGFRVLYMLQSKLGILKLRFPINPSFRSFITKADWLELNIPFFCPNNSHTKLNSELSSLKSKAEKILKHTYTFFSSTEFELGSNYNWITNPDTGYQYNISTHWSEIADLSKEAGDIKYVWEKARFTFIYDLIRYDYHYNENSSKFVFEQIEDFIDSNPINQGPNYKCSQEISLRILNWTYAMFYYRESSNLSDELFQKIINSIYWQLKHVRKNINFSRISVRNNHAITETSMLYLSGYFFPFISETKKWSTKGKKFLLQELNYQIYDDGSYLQFSHNYHRVVIQTLSWVLRINQLHKISFPKNTNNRLISTLDFLFQHQEQKTGWLPNYGNNDGALFYPLNDQHYRDFRPQLQVFGMLLGRKLYDELFEDTHWVGLDNKEQLLITQERASIVKYKEGGFFGFRDDALTTIRCGSYKDRPCQADALNLDIWYNGVNVLFDPGTYKYNTDQKYLSFYNGTKGHNTLTIGDSDQMFKGGRFIWFFWTKNTKSQIAEFDDRFEFAGEIEGFPLNGKRIKHIRKVIKLKNVPEWRIIDETNYTGNSKVMLHWNINPTIESQVDITAKNSNGDLLKFSKVAAWNSELYGLKNDFKQKTCSVEDGYCETIIRLNIK